MKSRVYKIKNILAAFESINGSSDSATRIELVNVHSAPGSAINEDLIAHHQGMYALDDSGDYIISGSAKGNFPGYFYPITNLHGRHLGKFELSDEISVSNTLTCTSGIQVAGNILAVGSEESVGISTKTDRSLIRFYNISSPDNVEHLTHLDIVRKGNGLTSSAVGIVNIDDQWIVAIRALESMDFFTLKGDIHGAHAKFESIGSIGLPENNIGKYENINLMANDSGELFVAGFCPDGDSNSADLLKIETRNNDAGKIIVVVSADLLSTKEFVPVDDGVKFKYAACLKFVPSQNVKGDVAEGKFEVYACNSHIDNTKITINKWG